MQAYIVHIVVVLTCVIFFIVYRHALSSQEKVLLIGILSAPQHFELRETIRKTWLQYIRKDISYYFLIGEHMCDIPMDDRVDEYSCEELPVFLPSGIGNNNFLQSGTFVCHNENVDVPVYSGYTFTVQRDIIIHRLGVVSSFCKHSVRVSLLEAATGFKITSATFLNDNSNSSSIIWKPVESYRLPKGFEGKIILESSIQPRYWQHNCGFSWSSSGNILAYHLFWSSHGQRAQFDNDSLTSVAIAFELADVDYLKEFLSQKAERKKLWDKNIASLQQQLKEEAMNNDDILFLNVVDVYRSLPKKMLKFYEWADSNVKFLYLLKTDDDTFISIPPIMKFLHSISVQDNELPNSMWWWSDFREGWPVQFAGKWREAAYHSVTYPPFPCGAGYVLNRAAVKFLNSVSDKLYTEYQGEDVALGIWLASSNPHSSLIRTPCFWTCDVTSLEGNVCNYPQLTAEKMLEIYQQKQEVQE